MLNPLKNGQEIHPKWIFEPKTKNLRIKYNTRVKCNQLIFTLVFGITTIVIFDRLKPQFVTTD